MAGKILTELKQTRPLSRAAEAALNIQKTADHLAASIARVLRSADLTASQYNVLRILRGAGREGLACGEIGGRMVTRDPDLTRLLDRLDKRGLVERSRCSRDRRVITVRITEAGQALVDELDEPVERDLWARLGRIEPGRLNDLIETLELMREPL